MAQPFCFGYGFWRTEKVSRAFPNDAMGIVGAQLATVAVMSLLWVAQAGDAPSSVAAFLGALGALAGAGAGAGADALGGHGTAAVPLAILWTGLMTTALTIYGETLAMRRLSASESTVILSTEPLFGTAFAAVLLGEPVGWSTATGAALVLLACVWSVLGPALSLGLGVGVGGGGGGARVGASAVGVKDGVTSAAAGVVGAAGVVASEGSGEGEEEWVGSSLATAGEVLKSLLGHEPEWWGWG
ncbi:unnamed protein product [Discosporangium mesarthrocarpum]